MYGEKKNKMKLTRNDHVFILELFCNGKKLTWRTQPASTNKPPVKPADLL